MSKQLPKKSSKFTSVLLTRVFALSAATLSFHSAQAYIVGTFGAEAFEKWTDTHVIVIGVGDEVGRLFARAAMAQARRLHEMYPDHRIAIYAAQETHDGRDRDFFENDGVTFIRYDNDTFSPAKLVHDLEFFRRIASLDIYTHSGWSAGASLEDSDNRLSPRVSGVQWLRTNFTDEAYAVIHGCNSGYDLAPTFADQWGIPVAGSLTSTDFQQLAEDQRWYHNNAGQYPTSGWASENGVSFQGGHDCQPGDYCYRMKPDNQPYNGVWGQYSAGLNFYKFFCKREDARCLAGIRNALLAQVSLKALSDSSSLADYRTVVKDWLCPNNADGSWRANCWDGLDRALTAGDRTFSTFQGQTLACTLKNCSFRQGAHGLEGTVQGPTTTLMDEYDLLLRAFGSPSLTLQ